MGGGTLGSLGMSYKNELLIAVLHASFTFCAVIVQGASAGEGALHVDAAEETRVTARVRHEQALQAIKENDLDHALELLYRLRQSAPAERAYLHDLVAVSSWAGRHADALREGETLFVRRDVPEYVLEALALSAREMARYDLALRLYARVHERSPRRLEPRIGRARTLLEADDRTAARAELLALAAEAPHRGDVFELLARLEEREQNWAGVLAAAQSILARNPTSSAGQRLRFNALRRLGAPHLALALDHQALSARELQDAERERIAHDLRWGRVHADHHAGATRWARNERATQHALRLASELDSAGRTQEASAERYDALVGLVDRGRIAEAIRLYEQLARSHLPPPYARLTAASAYLAAQQPETAALLYESALDADPRNLNARFGYFYALLESERHAEAVAFMQSLAASTPEWRDRDIPELRRENPDYPRVQAREGLALAYTNQLAAANAKLEALSARAPANYDIRNSRNTVHLLRGWPRLAQADYKWMLALRMDYAWAHPGLFDAGMVTRDYRLARASLERLWALIPEEGATLRRAREWHVHNMPELRVDLTFGRSFAGGAISDPSSSRERLLDTYLHSAPIATNWRVYSRFHHAQLRGDASIPNRNALGGGVEYRDRDWLGFVEVRGVNRGGASATAFLQRDFDDHLLLSGEIELNSLEVPLRAWASGVSAERVALTGSYRWHESRSASLGLAHMRFSDGNDRSAAYGAWVERLVSAAVFRLDLRGDFYASQNTLAAAAVTYFNPERDASLSGTFDAEWVQYRRYESALRHRVLAGLGTYWQDGYGGGSVQTLRYEIVYERDRQLVLGGGVGLTWRPFDGNRERLEAVQLTSRWRW